MAALWLLGTLLAQDGGRLNWRGGDPREAIRDAAQLRRPILLYFTSEG